MYKVLYVISCSLSYKGEGMCPYLLTVLCWIFAGQPATSCDWSVYKYKIPRWKESQIGQTVCHLSRDHSSSNNNRLSFTRTISLPLPLQHIREELQWLFKFFHWSGKMDHIKESIYIQNLVLVVFSVCCALIFCIYFTCLKLNTQYVDIL